MSTKGRLTHQGVYALMHRNTVIALGYCVHYVSLLILIWMGCPELRIQPRAVVTVYPLIETIL